MIVLFGIRVLLHRADLQPVHDHHLAHDATVRRRQVPKSRQRWHPPDPRAERDRCVWLHDRGAPVPALVEYGSDGHVEWLVTAALAASTPIPGQSQGQTGRTAEMNAVAAWEATRTGSSTAQERTR